MPNAPTPRITRIIVTPRYYDRDPDKKPIAYEIELVGNHISETGRTRGPSETKETAKATARVWRAELGVTCDVEYGAWLSDGSPEHTKNLARVNEANARARLRRDL